MKHRFAAFILFAVLFHAGIVFSMDSGKTDAGDKVMADVVQKAMGKMVKITKIDMPEDSPIKGLQQVRIWIETEYGDMPVLFYRTDNGKFIIGGSIFDEGGNNITKKDVGKTVPRKIEESEMKINDDYRLGSADAKVRAVLWVGKDNFSKVLFNKFHSVFKDRKASMSLSIKFYPRTENDSRNMGLLTCVKGEKAFDLYNWLFDTAPGWGDDEDIAAFKKEREIKDGDCNEDLIKDDIALAKTLRLPKHPVALINGVMLIEEISEGNLLNYLESLNK